jgi:hypothetical protein
MTTEYLFEERKKAIITLGKSWPSNFGGVAAQQRVGRHKVR